MNCEWRTKRKLCSEDMSCSATSITSSPKKSCTEPSDHRTNLRRPLLPQVEDDSTTRCKVEQTQLKTTAAVFYISFLYLKSCCTITVQHWLVLYHQWLPTMAQFLEVGHVYMQCVLTYCNRTGIRTIANFSEHIQMSGPSPIAVSLPCP